MKEISYRLRAALIQAIEPLTFNGVQIPVMDQVVNPSVPIPTVSGALAYVLINGQTNTETTDDKCGTRLDANISFDVVTKFPKGMGGSITSELIAENIMSEINRFLIIPDFKLIRVDMNFNQNLIEQATSETVFRKIVSYRFDVYED